MKDPVELQKLLKELKIPQYRGKQLLDAVFKQGKLDYDQMAVLPKAVREILKSRLPILSLKAVYDISSKDQSTRKAAFKLVGGGTVEAVLMRYQDGRNSVCISSQAGCQMGCKFCATGALGFTRNLTAEEITDQVLYFQSFLAALDEKISNVVFMGMGEPFLNYDEVMKAIGILNHPDYFHLASRRITVSTCGIVDGIKRFATENTQANLAVSLHAPNQKIRESIMPVARLYPLPQLLDAIENYCRKTNRRVSFEYVLLKGINDSESSAEELAEISTNKLIHINLIPYNNTSLNDISGSGREKTLAFQKILQKRGVNVTVRVSMGQDILAACGQLANKVI